METSGSWMKQPRNVDSVTALNDRGYSLKKKGSFPRVSGVGSKPTAELGNELICLLTYRPHGFERHRYKDACFGQFFIFWSFF